MKKTILLSLLLLLSGVCTIEAKTKARTKAKTHTQTKAKAQAQAKEYVERASQYLYYENNKSAFFCFLKANTLDPNNATAAFYLGNMICETALETADETMLKEGIAYFEKGTKIEPNNIRPLNNWAVYLAELLKMNDNYKEENTDTQRIRKAYLSVEQGGDQSGAYNLACHYSLLGDKEQAMQWLNTLMTKDYPKGTIEVSKLRLSFDSDFDNIRDSKEFLNFLDTHFPYQHPVIEEYAPVEIADLNEGSFSLEDRDQLVNALSENDQNERITMQIGDDNGNESLTIRRPIRGIQYVCDLDETEYYLAHILCEKAKADGNPDLYKRGLDQYTLADKTRPNNPYILNSWACDLSRYTKLVNDHKSNEKKIRKLLERVEKSGDQTGAYNLACHYSIIGNKKKAIQWLKTAVTKTYETPTSPMSRNSFTQESDFDNIRHTPEFETFLNTYFPKPY